MSHPTTDAGDELSEGAIVVLPGNGRAYTMGAMHSVFMADGVETDDRYTDAPRGSFLRVPAGVTHDFSNRSAERAGVLNVYIPGGFEAMMPSIVAWYAARDGSSGR